MGLVAILSCPPVVVVMHMLVLFLGYVDVLTRHPALALERLHRLALHGEGARQLRGKGRVSVVDCVPPVKCLGAEPHHHHVRCSHLRSERRL